jgi:hypothetical protein
MGVKETPTNMFKKLVIASALALGLGILSQSSSAQADTKIVQVNPAVMKAINTNVHGTITVTPSQASGDLAGFQCSNLTIVATSKEYNPAPPGVFASPKWTRTANATGSWASGQCSYSIVVPGGQQFGLTAGGNGNFDCSVIAVGLSGTPQYQTVAKGTQKVDNMTVTMLSCQNIY